ncbi:MAG: hypothetical protein E5X24_24830 [Mesorhizobium sp.]|nr:MAG: hypothetical protein E5X24_24830 [Mesorhizobium sp.]
MGILFAFFIALVLSGTTLPASAQDEATPPAASPPPAITPPPVASTRQGRLDQLFADLRRERNEKAAERIAGRIWNEWNQSGSASIDLMMRWAQRAAEDQKFDVALDFLDQVVTLQPDYAEGWNRRATVHFLMKNYGKSMSDIDHTLSGLAQIMAETGHKQSALEAWQKVLTIYPMMRSAQGQVSTLSEDLAGEGI